MTVDRRSDLSLREFRNDYMLANRPVVIENATPQWDAMSKWTPNFFREHHADKEVSVDGTTYPLAEFMDVVDAGSPSSPSPYLSNLVIRRRFPEILSDVLPGLAYALSTPAKDRLVRKVGYETGPENVEFYLGGRGTRFSTLHFDNFYMHAFITQVFGDKEFLLVPPSQSHLVYAGGDLPSSHRAKTMRLDTAISYHSSIPDVFDPDYERFPLFRDATPTTLVAGAGDTVFIPSGWWHATRMLTTCIAVSTNTMNTDNLRNVARTYDFPERSSPRRRLIDRVGRPLVRPVTWTSEQLLCRQR